MALQLSPATLPEDLPAIIGLQFAAFYHPATYGALHAVLFPGGDTPTARAAAAAQTWRILAGAENVRHLKVVDTATGEMVSAGKWIYEHGAEEEDEHGAGEEEEEEESDEDEEDGAALDWYTGPAAEEREIHALFDREYAEFLCAEGARRRAAHVRGRPCWVLDGMFTHPAHQRRGAGGMIVGWGVRRAREMGVLAVVEASAAGRRLYEKWGFVLREHVCLEVPEKWRERERIEYWILVRPLKGPKGERGTGGQQACKKGRPETVE